MHLSQIHFQTKLHNQYIDKSTDHMTNNLRQNYISIYGEKIIHYTKRHFTVIVSGMLLTFFKRSPLTAFVYEHGYEENAYTFTYLINLMSLHGQITFKKLPLFIVYSSSICRMYCTFSSQYFRNANIRNHILSDACCKLVLYLIVIVWSF